MINLQDRYSVVPNIISSIPNLPLLRSQNPFFKQCIFYGEETAFIETKCCSGRILKVATKFRCLNDQQEYSVHRCFSCPSRKEKNDG